MRKWSTKNIRNLQGNVVFTGICLSTGISASQSLHVGHFSAVVVKLLDPFGHGRTPERPNTQSGHASRSGPEIKEERSRAKNDTPKRLRCWIVKNEVI